VALVADPRLLLAVGERLPVEALVDDAGHVLIVDGSPEAWETLAGLPRAEADYTARLLRRLPCVVIARHANPPLRAGFDLVDPMGGCTTAVCKAPDVSLTAALLVREPRVDILSALAAESAAYSMLQASDRFIAWLMDQGLPAEPIDVGEPRVGVERRGHVTFVSLTRPRRHNALDPAMRDALVSALDSLRYERSAPIVLRGDGPSFCSGGDLATFGESPAPAEAHAVRMTRSPARSVAAVADRLIVGLHGHCVGAGIELAAFAGRVVCADDAHIRLPEMALGLVPGAGGTWSIPHRIGRQRFMELFVTGRTISAAIALQWGLVDEVVAPTRLDARLEEIAGMAR
jgi:enoyl-CoA hydratase/carnithine racemase